MPPRRLARYNRAMRRALVAGALAFAFAFGAASAARADAGDPDPLAPAPFVPWHEPSPLARLFLQLPFEGPEALAAGQLHAEARVVYSNSLLLDASTALALDVHVETAQLTLFFREGLGEGIELQLAIPALVDTGGFLDRPIELVEGWFHARNPQRRGVPRDVASFRLMSASGSGIDRRGPAAGLGDLWGGLKVELAAQRGLRPALSVRGAIKVPSGRGPFGSGTLDAGGSLLLGWSGARLSGCLSVDAAAPTGDLRAPRLRTRPYGALQGGLAWRAAEHVTLDVQASAHASPLAGTGFTQIDGATYYLLGGVVVALPRGLALTAAVVENVFSPYRGADITFVVALGG